MAFVETAEMVLLGSTKRGEADRKDGIVVDLGHRSKRIDLVKDGKVDIIYSLSHVSSKDSLLIMFCLQPMSSS